MSRVFISYRRDDSRWVARALKDKLAHAIGEDQIFMDIDSIDPGMDFVDVLDQTVSKVDVVIAIIGPKFLTVKDDQGKRRIDNPKDFVRLEIASALKRNIRVIPLLESGTPMPAENDLPEDLKPLARRNAVEVRESSFDSDVDRIVKSLEKLWAGKETGRPTDTKKAAVAPAARKTTAEKSRTSHSQTGGNRWFVPVIAAVSLLAIIGIVFAFSGLLNSNPENSSQANRENGTSKTPANSPIVQEGTDSAPNQIVSDPKQPSAKSPEIESPKIAAKSTSEPPIAEKPTDPVPDPIASGPIQPPATLGMKWISPGSFVMGSPNDEAGRRNDEKQHKVEITEGFFLGETEVTQVQYSAITGQNPSQSKKPDAPVENVSWGDAVEFCEKLNDLETLPEGIGIGKLPPGFKFTLPAEAQWEYACRAGTTERISERDLIKSAVCYERNTDGWKEPQSVKSKKPNAWGLYDMLGNVEEWCLDVYGPYPDGPVTDPVNNAGGGKYVMRGGSYFHSNVAETHFCREAVRASGTQSGFRSPTCGFRLAAVKSK